MGLLVNSPYTTEQGIVLPQLYIALETFRFVRCLGTSKFSGTFQVGAYVSRDDKYSGRSALTLPNPLQYVDILVGSADLAQKPLYEIAYPLIKQVWTAAGYSVSDVFEVAPVVAETNVTVEPTVESTVESTVEAP